jgi:replicative DNA helicase
MGSSSMNNLKSLSWSDQRIKKETQEILSGFQNFDKTFGGFSLGEFVVLGGRPSMGKTQLLLSICKSISESLPVLYFTFDQSVSIIAARFLSSLSNIPIDNILQNKLDPTDKNKLAYFEKYSAKYKLVITDKGISIDDFKDLSLKHIKVSGTKIIIVDYLQKMKAEKKGNNSHLSTITDELRTFAKDNDVTIIAISQLNRALETRGGDKRPQLNDLKGSDSIEEDADKVIFMYRPEYYGITVDENGNNAKGLVELIMAKNKNGKLGTIRLLRDINFSVYQ